MIIKKMDTVVGLPEIKFLHVFNNCEIKEHNYIYVSIAWMILSCLKFNNVFLGFFYRCGNKRDAVEQSSQNDQFIFESTKK